MKLTQQLLVLLTAAVTSSAYVVVPSTMTSTCRYGSTETPDNANGSVTTASLVSPIALAPTIFTSEQIDAILPHRYPFALVDKVVEYEAGKSAVGVKCVTKNEEFFQGHFPGRPVMPGVLQIEALAQLAGIVCLQMEGASPGSVFFFAGVDGVKWKQPVVPGDTVILKVDITKWSAKFGLAKATGKAYVGETLVLDVAEMTFALAKE